MNFLRPKEKFLVMEVAPRRTTAWFLSVDEDRNISFERYTKNVNLKTFFKFTKAPARSLTQKAWEGKHFFKSRRKVIVAADPEVATTIPIPLALHREARGETKLTTAELENLIAQAMQKIFNGCRNEAAQRLNVNELDAVMVGAKAKHFRIDGKEVQNPEGFPGKKITLLLELTFTSRELFEDLKQFFNSPDDFFFAEAPQAHLNSIARVRKLPLNLIRPADDGASLFVLQKIKDAYPVLYREKLPWSATAFTKALRDTFAVSEKAAHTLYRSYQKGEVSEGASRFMKRALQPAFENFLSAVERMKVEGGVYLDAREPLPVPLPYRHGKAEFIEHPTEELLKELGFTLPASERTNGAIRALTYFLEAYFDKSNTDINHKLRRRLHWLLA